VRGFGGKTEARPRTEREGASGAFPGPIARRREPEGKGATAGAVGRKSGRVCLGGRGNAPAGGRQARPDLSRDKSGEDGEH
jgi:hypothetical protein